MKLSIITMVTAAFLASTAFASSGFLGSCSEFAITNLEGDEGRSMMLQASCKVDDKNKNWSQLDLNRCFGWDKDNHCGFTYPPASGFTSVVGKCSNHYSGGEEHFGSNFGCFGPCNGGGTIYNVFALNSYIGNNNGYLTC